MKAACESLAPADHRPLLAAPHHAVPVQALFCGCQSGCQAHLPCCLPGTCQSNIMMSFASDNLGRQMFEFRSGGLNNLAKVEEEEKIQKGVQSRLLQQLSFSGARTESSESLLIHTVAVSRLLVETGERY